MDTKLKPCQFCGGRAYIERESDSDGCGAFFTVRCQTCSAETGPRFASYGGDCPQFYAEVREQWNTRSALSSVEGAAPVRGELSAQDRADLRVAAIVFKSTPYNENPQAQRVAATLARLGGVKDAAGAPDTIAARGIAGRAESEGGNDGR